MNQIAIFNKNRKKGRLATPFKKAYALEKRKEEARRIITKYPDRIPVICERKTLAKHKI